MQRVVISGTGLYTPSEAINNDELVVAFNGYVQSFNQRHAADIAAGTTVALAESSAEFIAKASGIRSRHVVTRDGLLNPERLAPSIPAREDGELSLQAEMAVAAGREALQHLDRPLGPGLRAQREAGGCGAWPRSRP